MKERKVAEESLVAATERAIADAKHLTPSDAGAVEGLLAVARKIDAWDVIVQWALDDAADTSSRPKVPQNDNVSLPTYLKFCDALGLTPAGRERLTAKNDDSGGKLAQLRAVHGGEKSRTA